MNKHFLLFYAYFLITTFRVNAQHDPCRKIYDRFAVEVKGLKEDTNKVLRLLEYAKMLNYCSHDTVLSITKKAKTLSYKLNYARGIELSLYQEGVSAETQNNYSSAIRYYNEASKVAEAHQFTANTYLVYNSCLNIYYYLADYANAMEVAQKGLSLSEKQNNKEYEAYYNNQAAFIYQKQEKADESIAYGEQYLKLAKDIKNRMMIADADNEIGDALMIKKDYTTSLIYFSNALAIYSKMNLTERLNSIQTIVKPDRIAYTLFKMSSAYKQQGNFKRALQYSLAVLDLCKKNPNTFNRYDLASYYINAGEIHSSLKNYSQGAALLKKGLAIARSILHREDIRDAYAGISENFAYRKRYDSAYYYHIFYTRLKDSIINEKTSREINKLEVDRRGKEITLLNQQEKLKETENARQNLLQNFIIGLAGFVVIISFLLFYIKSTARNQKLIFEKQLAIQAERQRISSDMHDDIGTGLSTMLIYINMLRIKLNGNSNGFNIDRISALGSELVDQMKEIVWSLNPGNDRLDSLVLYLRQYFVLLFEPLPHQIHIDFPLTIPDIQLEGETRRNIFLCVKESLNNVIKHAEATEVWLTVQITRSRLIIQIKDNGTGLEPAIAGNSTGNGLKNIKQRVEAIKGKLNIDSNDGTTISFEVSLATYPNREFQSIV